MAILKCKMCGGDVTLDNNKTYGTCEFCGNTMTFPKVDDDQRAAAFNRGNHFRRIGEFDKALAVYERIVNEDNTDAEAHWCSALCRFGIEYVEDPTTFEWIPTCHRASFDSFLEDVDYLAAVEFSDGITKKTYQKEAARIAEIQRGILATSQNEEPFDVFICYKESDEDGNRTKDSLMAQDIYYQLTDAGYRVFFSRITLEDMVGKEYEPYIFAALNSAKAMVVVGTKAEYLNAVWVKNEWSRYLALMKRDRSRVLLPCYRDMDPYDMPEALSVLQSYDMGKIGFVQDLLRGIKKIVAKDEPKVATKETVVLQQGVSNNNSALLKRGFLALEDCEWDKADGFFEEALNQDAECGDAYWGKYLAESKAQNESILNIQLENKYANADSKETLAACSEDNTRIASMVAKYSLGRYLNDSIIKGCYAFNRNYTSELSCRKNQKSRQLYEIENDKNLVKARRYASGKTKEEIDGVIAHITEVLELRIAEEEKNDEARIKTVTQEYQNFLVKADEMVVGLREEADARKERDYNELVGQLDKTGILVDVESIKNSLEDFSGYKDADEQVQKANAKIKSLLEDMRRKEEKEEEDKKRKAKKKKVTNITIGVVIAAIIVFMVFLKVLIIPTINYNKAINLRDEGKYIEAYESLIALEGFKDSKKEAIKIFDHYKIEKMKLAKVGDTVLLGKYEQDNDTSNGKEDIEWIVLGKENGKLLVISKYALDCKKYNFNRINVTWSDCTLRTWLNSSFLEETFSTDEQEIITMSKVSTHNNPKHGTSSGNMTSDRVFLLSIEEVEKYFSSAKERQCLGTAYANTSNGNYMLWWLRSPGENQEKAVYVGQSGEVIEKGYFVDFAHHLVRPALWVDISDK